MNRFFSNSKAFFKNILVTDERILASDEDYGSQEAFIAKMESGKKGKLDTHVNLALPDIERIIPYPAENAIQVFYGNEKAAFDFAEHNDYEEVLAFLLAKKPLQPITEKVGGGVITYIKPLLYTLSVALFGVVLVAMAAAHERGEAIAISGANRGKKRLLAQLAELLGLTGSLVLSTVATGALLFYTARKIAASKKEMTVYR